MAPPARGGDPDTRVRPVVIRFGRMGDMVLLAPLLGLLHRGYGVPCTLFGGGPWSGALFAAHPDVGCALQLRNHHRPLALNPPLWRMLGALARRRDAAVYVCEPEAHPLARIRTMLAVARVPPGRCTFLVDAPTWPDEHWVDRLLRYGTTPPRDCAAAWHAPGVPYITAPRLFVRDDDRRDCDSWLRARGWRGEPVWLVQPCNHISRSRLTLRDAARDRKSWPTPCWIEALRALRADHPDARILLTGAPHEVPTLDGVVGSARDARIDVAARDLPVRRLMALAEIAQGMLSVDTGPAHVAAAMGCPLVVLFGAVSPRVWCPRNPTDGAVLALGGLPGRKRVAQVAPAEVITALRNLPPRRQGGAWAI